MKTIILNGSPKININESNTKIIIDKFISGMNHKCEVRYIARENPKDIVKELQEFEVIIIAMPLYIHAMPSCVMKLIECMKPEDFNKQKLGFIVQAGFPESINEKYLKEYFEILCGRLGCEYIGTVVHGNSAFIYRAPKKYDKVLKIIRELGAEFERTGNFDKHLVDILAQPYKFNKLLLRLLGGLCDSQWKEILKENGAIDHALDRPFIHSQS